MFLIPAFGQTFDDEITDTGLGHLVKEGQKPNVLDAGFTVDEFTTGLSFPTTMTFIDNDLHLHIAVIILTLNNGITPYFTMG